MNDLLDHEQVLARFRVWLEETRDECFQLSGSEPVDDPQCEPIGLYQLTQQLTATRQEVKLLTKASRDVDERHEATLLSLNAAIEQFRDATQDEGQVVEKATSPLVEAIIALDESLVRGRSVIEQSRQRLLGSWNAELREARDRLDELYRMQPWWRRTLIRAWHQATREVYSGRSLETGRNIFDSLLEGYDLILDRLRVAMHELSIVRMDCVGEQADPHCATVLEVVSDPGRQPGTVVEEVRPGYFFRGKVFRFAEVKAVSAH